MIIMKLVFKCFSVFFSQMFLFLKPVFFVFFRFGFFFLEGFYLLLRLLDFISYVINLTRFDFDFCFNRFTSQEWNFPTILQLLECPYRKYDGEGIKIWWKYYMKAAVIVCIPPFPLTPFFAPLLAPFFGLRFFFINDVVSEKTTGALLILYL